MILWEPLGEGVFRMKMFLQRIAVRQRRNLLIFCMLLTICAFIISYINLNGTTSFNHKLHVDIDIPKSEVHDIIQELIRDPSLPVNKSTSNNHSNLHTVSEKSSGKLTKRRRKLANLQKESEDMILKDKFNNKLRTSFNSSISADKIRQKSKELQGNIEKQKFLYSKAYKDILHRSKQFEDGPDEHTGHHPIQISSRRSNGVAHEDINFVQNDGFINKKKSVVTILSPGFGNVRETDASFKDKEKLRTEIKSVRNVLTNGGRKDTRYEKENGYRKHKGYRKDIHDKNDFAERSYQRETGYAKNIADPKETRMTIGKARDLIPMQDDINLLARKPSRNFADHGMDSVHVKDIDAVNIFDGNKAWPIKFTEDEAPSDNKRPESCYGCMTLNFQFVSNPTNLCKRHRQPPELLILIASDPREDFARLGVRHSWGKVCNNINSSVACAFMVATTTDSDLNEQVLEESAKYHDIIVFSYIDSYQNLTYKTLMGLKWSQEYCSEAKYVMKTDQDVYVNTRQIPILLQAAPNDHFSGGFCWGLSIPKRDTSKWAIKHTEFSAPYLPKMCSGTGYILSKDVVSSILRVSPNIPFLYLEDVYIALCLEKIDVTPTNLAGFNNMRSEFSPCNYRYYVMTSHQISTADLIDYWQLTDECPPEEMTPDLLYSPLHLNDLI